jgi:hypothetical protein
MKYIHVLEKQLQTLGPYKVSSRKKEEINDKKSTKNNSNMYGNCKGIVIQNISRQSATMSDKNYQETIALILGSKRGSVFLVAMDEGAYSESRVPSGGWYDLLLD